MAVAPARAKVCAMERRPAKAKAFAMVMEDVRRGTTDWVRAKDPASAREPANVLRQVSAMESLWQRARPAKACWNVKD